MVYEVAAGQGQFANLIAVDKLEGTVLPDMLFLELPEELGLALRVVEAAHHEVWTVVVLMVDHRSFGHFKFAEFADLGNFLAIRLQMFWHRDPHYISTTKLANYLAVSAAC